MRVRVRVRVRVDASPMPRASKESGSARCASSVSTLGFSPRST